MHSLHVQRFKFIPKLHDRKYLCILNFPELLFPILIKSPYYSVTIFENIRLWTKSCSIDYKIQQWYFVTKIVLTYCEKKLFLWSRKTFEIQGWRLRICKIFEITRKIYSNIERSEQFLVTECFFNLFLEISHT